LKMPKPKDRSKKRVYRRTPSGRVKIVTKKARKHVPRCAVCGAMLKGASYSRYARKSERRPERAFGGYLCHKCAEKVILYRTRVKNNDMTLADVPLVLQKYL